jgi:hypothetical protein
VLQAHSNATQQLVALGLLASHLDVVACPVKLSQQPAVEMGGPQGIKASASALLALHS